MSKFILQTEGRFPDEFIEISRHETYDEAEEAAGVLFDNGNDGDFRIVEEGETRGYRLRGYTFQKAICPVCGKVERTRNMERTRDCHGIPFRTVCRDCYDRIMDEKGYDGEEYSELDECLDADY